MEISSVTASKDTADQVDRVITRSEFGVDCNVPMDAGGLLLGDEVEVVLEIEGNLVL